MQTKVELIFILFMNLFLKSGNSEKTGRQFTLFSIISFPDDLCETNNAKIGTCLNYEKCESKGGVNMGSCANGFGVCCYFSVSKCSSSIVNNSSYILNPNFPNSFNNPGTCTYYINKEKETVCQFRLDFRQFVLTNPPSSGDCSPVDWMAISTSGQQTPMICGKNTNYHMFVDVGLDTTSNSELTFYLTGTLQNRYWEIQVTQLSCMDPNLAPGGCLQYHVGLTGVIESFNWQNSDAKYHLANQCYAICIRHEHGHCSITYTPTKSSPGDALYSAGQVTSGLYDWALDQRQDCSDAALCRGEAFCSTDYIIIPQGSSGSVGEGTMTFDRFCGKALNDRVAADQPSSSVAITSHSLPFIIHFKSGPLNDGEDRGFRLAYRQNTC